jgi:hypothetical protein
MLAIVSATVPVFLKVELCDALVVPTPCDANVRLVGVSVTVDVPAAPVPVSATVWGLEAASSVIARFAVRAPAAVGANETETVQLDPTASVLGLTGHVLVWV